MNELESKTKEIAQSGLMIELDISADSVLMLAFQLTVMKANSPTGYTTRKFDILLSQFISALEFNFPGTHSILFPEVELVNRKYEEL